MSTWSRDLERALIEGREIGGLRDRDMDIEISRGSGEGVRESVLGSEREI